MITIVPIDESPTYFVLIMNMLCFAGSGIFSQQCSDSRWVCTSCRSSGGYPESWRPDEMSYRRGNYTKKQYLNA